MSSFYGPAADARYAEGPVRMVPGFQHLQRMAALLLAERVDANGRVLVLGAGGGHELKAFAEFQPGWRLAVGRRRSLGGDAGPGEADPRPLAS